MCQPPAGLTSYPHFTDDEREVPGELVREQSQDVTQRGLGNRSARPPHPPASHLSKALGRKHHVYLQGAHSLLGSIEQK